MKFALFLGVGGRILAREHAHETNVVGAIAQDLQRLHQASESIARDAHLLFDLGGGLRGPRILDRRGRLGGRRFVSGTFAGGLHGSGLIPCCCVWRGGFGRRLDGLAGSFRRRLDELRSNFRRCLDGDNWLGRRSTFRLESGGLRLADLGCGGRALDAFGRRCLGRGWRRTGRTVGATDNRRLAQDGAGELGDGLHGASI